MEHQYNDFSLQKLLRYDEFYKYFGVKFVSKRRRNTYQPSKESLDEDILDEDILQHGQRESATNINLNQPPPSHSEKNELQNDQNSLNGDIWDEDIVQQDLRESAININLNQPPSCEENESQAYQNSLNEDIWDEDIMQQDHRESAININLNQPPLNEENESQGGRTRKRKKMLSNDERRLIHLALLKRSVNGKLQKGTRKEVSQIFYVSTKTITRIWKQAKNSSIQGTVDVIHRKTKKCGLKRVEIDLEQFGRIPLSRRTSIRSTSCAINMSKSSLHRNYQHGDDIRRHTNHVKPLLKDSNKKARVQFCLSMIDKNSGDVPKFSDMFNVIHIDEKWFYITKKTEKYYLLANERDLVRACKSKFFVTKVMFLATMARPRFDSDGNDGNEKFSRKIGIFPFITEQPSKRSSVNMSAGTLETKPITSVGKDLSRSYLIHKVLPAILKKWPADDGKITITIQQDNAMTHIDPNDEEFRLAVSIWFERPIKMSTSQLF